MRLNLGRLRFGVALMLVVLAGTQFACTSRKTPKVIAIVNLQRHPILDAVEEGTRAELARQGFGEGDGTRYVVHNASGDMQRVASIASEVAALEPDVTIAISTPIAQAIVKRARGPVVFGALTDPLGAGVVASLDGSVPNVTGTTDALPYEEQLRLVREILPSAKRLGVIFNPGEAASQHAIKELRRVHGAIGLELVEAPANSTVEVYPVAQNLVGRVDAILISTDNTVAAGIAGAVKVAVANKIPLFACDSGSVEKGAVAAVSPGYRDIGVTTGKLAARVLRGERNIPVVPPSGGEVYLNRKAAELMGVPIPAPVRARATKSFDQIP